MAAPYAAAVRDAMADQPYCSWTMARARRATARARSDSRAYTASLGPSGSCGAKVIPVTPGSTISASPPVRGSRSRPA
ncbi:hypothetical protein ACGFI9_34420 [Micromonospora sp. NPDC048930]|uniref:hypothetical protein n=1 Tax=Micromonospora sp. NPDC048930 TaxID=3364261 RepID=UPI0037182162